jgi:hypothetical protein
MDRLELVVMLQSNNNLRTIEYVPKTIRDFAESHYLSLFVHKQGGHASSMQQPPHLMDQKDSDTVKAVEGTLQKHLLDQTLGSMSGL